MSGIYKNLDRSDVRVTPFKAYKKYYGTGTQNDTYTYYEGTFEKDLINLGANGIPDSAYTTNDKLKQSVFHSVDHLFYREFLSNNKATFGSGNINSQIKVLYDKVGVVSIPQQNFGEGILPGSLILKLSNTINDRGYGSTITLVDDLKGNLIISGGYTGTIISQSNEVYKLRTDKFLPHIFETQSYSYTDVFAPINTINTIQNTYITTCSFGMSLNFTGQVSSSLIIAPATDEDNLALNFIDQDFSIGMWLFLTNPPIDGVILQKKAPVEIKGVDENGNTIQNTLNRYPYSIVYDEGASGLFFRKSDGFTTIEAFAEVSIDEWIYVTLSRSGSQYELAATGSTTNALTNLTDTLEDYKCSNTSNIYVGGNYSNLENLKVNLSQLKFWNKGLTTSNKQFLTWSSGSNSLAMGNVFYKQGLITLTDPFVLTQTGSKAPIDCEFRGTVTLYETEYTCTISPGEFEFSNNPTIHVYDPTTNQFKLRAFATGSDFKPYITQIGLYDDQNRLVVTGKLSQPVKVPGNVDTTFIVKYDN